MIEAKSNGRANGAAGGTSSGAFTDTNKNRDSLVPVPARAPDAACVHRGVVSAEVAKAFSGERGHPVYPIRLPSNTVSLSIGDLAPSAQTSNHRHAYESLVYVIEGEGHTDVEGQRFEWRATRSTCRPGAGTAMSRAPGARCATSRRRTCRC
jgi:hypothetical protein